MSLLAVELNDWGICAARSGADDLLVLDDGQRWSPGFAYRQKKLLVTGAAAAQQARLQPMAVSNRFWDQLDTEPNDPNDPRSSNRAEVACAHLRHVLQNVCVPDEPVVLAVPPVYDEQQLGYLVAMVQEMQLPLKGLVASPIAVEMEPPVSGEILIVEPSLHRTVLSLVDARRRIMLSRTRICHGVGLDAFLRQWLKAIGGECVRTTRFDPRHDAPTEQRLNDAIPEILEAVASDGSHQLALEAGSLTHRVTVTEQLLEQAGHSLIFTLSKEVEAVASSSELSMIALSHVAMRVPGLHRLVQQQAAVPVVGLAAGAAATGLLGAWPDQFPMPDDEGVPYHTWRQPSAAAAELAG
jgi:hypothetical protein